MRNRRAFRTRRAPCVAGPPAVAEQVHVELELLAARGELEHRVVQLLERRALAEQARGACPRVRRACRPGRRACRRRTAARRPRSCGRRRAARSARRGPARRSRRARWSMLGGSSSSRRIAWIRADLTFEMPPGRIASSTSALGASRTAAQLPKRLRSAEEGDVAVAVVGRLREDGEDQLVEALPVRRRERAAVELAEAVADAPDAGAAGRRHGGETVSRHPAVTAATPIRGNLTPRGMISYRATALCAPSQTEVRLGSGPRTDSRWSIPATDCTGATGPPGP